MKTLTSSFVLLLALSLSPLARAATPGQATLKVTTAPLGGRYAPKHVMAVWITDAQDQLVKTVAVYAGKRKKHLRTWLGLVGEQNVDGVVGATLKEHGQMDFTWDLLDAQGKPVPPGVYRWNIELTDRNKLGVVTPPGHLEFTVGPEPSQRKAQDLEQFLGLELSFTPARP